MAVWQFKFHLVPEDGILRVHGRMVAVLEAYRGPSLSGANYWEGFDPVAMTLAGVSALLPEEKSPDPAALVFGAEDGDRVEIRPHDVQCQADIRNYSIVFVGKLLELARDCDCKIVIHGSGDVITPEWSAIIPKLAHSDARKFCADPVKFMTERAKAQS